ncbi:MAG TPA: hypothetical protein VKN62_10940, partial [Pelovirga sp.]|nr:hypothetical protein [Pelovirga sp.]
MTVKFLCVCSVPDRDGAEYFCFYKVDALAKSHGMAKQKFCPPRPGGFSGAQAYMSYVKVLKKRRNAGGRTFCDAIKVNCINKWIGRLIICLGLLILFCHNR